MKSQRTSYDIISLIISTLFAPISDTRLLPGSKKSLFDERWHHGPREKTSFSFASLSSVLALPFVSREFKWKSRSRLELHKSVS